MLLTDDDRPTLLALTRGNAEKNAALLLSNTVVDVQPLVWGSTAPPSGSRDWIIGSDLAYVAEGTARLCQTIQLLLLRGSEGDVPPRVILAHQDRPVERGGVDGSLAELESIAAEHGLTMTKLRVDRDPSHGYPPTPVAILELKTLMHRAGDADVNGAP